MRLSFRAKLLLAMMLVVGGVTVATLLATQRKVRATYDRLFHEQFEMEVSAFSARQEARLGLIREKCAVAAQRVRLSRALEEELESLDLYRIADDELGLAGFDSLRMAPAELFIRFLDGRGRVIHPPTKDGPGEATTRQRLERQFRSVGAAMDKLETQHFGYIAPDADKGAAHLLEVIVTRCTDANGEAVGALVVGRPAPDLSASTPAANRRLQAGLWLDGELHSTGLPAPAHAAVAGRLDAAIRASPGHGDFVADISGAAHRVFFRLLNPNSPLPPAHQVCLYSLAEAAQAQADLRTRILTFGGLALGLAFVLSLLISHGLSVPLREVVAGTVQIKGGNFTARVPVRSGDEVGQLASAFNDMADGLALKEKYHNVLSMVADKDVAEQLMRGDVKLGGELRDVSVLFCDIRGFTALTQGMPPEQVIAMLNEHMDALTRVVYEHQGVVDKFVGDLVMAIFGAPKSYGHDGLRAARCARRMIEERAKLNDRSAHRIEIGIGIATGEVVAGCMGASNRVDYTVLGERVNLAARLCGQAGSGQIVIDQSTRDQLGGVATVAELAPRRLKGFDEAVTCFELIDVKPTAANL